MKTCIKALVLLLLCSATASASIHHAFNAESCAWLTTHIVVVTEGDEIDGRVTVLESLQGDLKAGDSLDILELAKFKSEQSRRIGCVNVLGILQECAEDHHNAVSGSKIILFLRRVDQSGMAKWSALGALWVEHGFAYGIYDGHGWNGTLRPLEPESTVRDKIARVAYEKAALKSALETEDIDARIDALRPLATSSVYVTATIASVELGALKKTKSLNNQGPNALSIPTVKCNDDCTEPFLALALKREVEFWKEAVLHMKAMQWLGQSIRHEEWAVYRTHSGYTESVVSMLRGTDRVEIAMAVRELRDSFLSSPQLKNEALIIKTCNSFLHEN